jgi:hypothetical protein
MADGTPGIGVMLGAGCELHALGRTWKVSAPDQNAKERLEKLAAATALEEVRRLKGMLDAAAYQEAFDRVTQNLRNYRTWKPGWQSVVFDPENAHLFLWSLLKGNHPDIDGDTVLAVFTDAPEEVAAAYAQILPDFFTMLLEPLAGRLTPELRAEVDAALARMVESLRRKPTPTNST